MRNVMNRKYKRKKPRKKPPSERSELVSLFKEFIESMFVHGIFSCMCTCRTKTCMVILGCQDVTCVLKY